MATNMGTKKDHVIWYFIGFVAVLWGIIGIMQGSATPWHWLTFPFMFGCVLQPARNAKKREKKRKQENFDKAMEKIANS